MNVLNVSWNLVGSCGFLPPSVGDIAVCEITQDVFKMRTKICTDLTVDFVTCKGSEKKDQLGSAEGVQLIIVDAKEV